MTFPKRCGLLVVGCLIVGLHGVKAQPAQPGRMVGYGDERIVTVAEEWAAFSSANADLIASVPVKTVSFSSAIARARALAASAASSSAVKAMRTKVPGDDDAAAYRLLAVREIGAGRLGGTLCLLVAACDGAPDDADTLTSLAAVLAMLGEVNEAEAILDELARRGWRPSPPMGLSPDDVLDYVRGYCALRHGDQAEARKQLEAVAARQPLLAEASRLLALLDEKEGKDPRKNFLLGVWRHKPKVNVCGGDLGSRETDASAEGATVAADLRSMLDMSKAIDGFLPPLRYATTPQQALTLKKKIDETRRALSAEMEALQARAEAIPVERYRDGAFDRVPTWGQRMYDLLVSLDYRDGRLREIERARHELTGKITVSDLAERHQEAAEKASEGAKDWEAAKQAMYPHYVAALGEARTMWAKLENIQRDQFNEWHRLASAIVAQVGDPQWHEVLRLHVEQHRLLAYSSLLICSSGQANVSADIFGEDDGQPLEKPKEESLYQCDGTKSVGVSLSLLATEEAPVDFGVEITCDGVSVELAGELLPHVQFSGEIGLDPKGGFTAFVGPKVNATVLGAGVASKGGIYISGSKDGVSDAGVKLETKTVGNAGPFSVASKVSDVSVSIIPSPRPSPPADLQPLIFK